MVLLDKHGHIICCLSWVNLSFYQQCRHFSKNYDEEKSRHWLWDHNSLSIMKWLVTNLKTVVHNNFKVCLVLKNTSVIIVTSQCVVVLSLKITKMLPQGPSYAVGHSWPGGVWRAYQVLLQRSPGMLSLHTAFLTQQCEFEFDFKCLPKTSF